jgi:Ca2+-binding EF-hand superfamily protein
MKRLPSLLVIASAFAVLLAAVQSGMCQSTSEDMFRKRAEESFKAHDVDNDGYLIGEEIPGEIRVLLALAKASPETRLNFRQFLEYREEAFRVQVASSFKNRDRNGDGFLQKHEMPLQLIKDLAKYVGGRDRVDFLEYLRFCRDREFPLPPMPPSQADSGSKGSQPMTQIIDQTEIDKGPVVYRAGKLPKELPDWFEKLDMDKDGQISLYEWRKGGKSLAEFKLWDRNDDGLVTFDEVLRKLKMDRAFRSKGGPPRDVNPDN